MKKSTTLLILLLICPWLTWAQVRTKRINDGRDLRTLGLMGPGHSIPILRLDAVDVAPLLEQDAQDAQKNLPFRFGVQRPVDVNIITESATTKENGHFVYEYRIESVGAVSINLIFDQLHLKKGARMFLYNGDRSMMIGPVTDAQNVGNGEYWTDLVEGSSMFIELQEPIGGAGESRVHLSTVVHGYKKVLKAFGDAGSCHPNMVCYPDYQVQGDGVAMILLAGGTRLCTGSMVNSTRQTFRSFFLSAFHCLDRNNSGIAEPGELSEVQNWLVRFDYQSPTCTPSQEDLDVITLNGNTFRAGYAASDVLLVELNQQVPTEVNTTYNGWNRSAETTSNNFSIHHPRGDVKKISFTNADTQPSGYGGGFGDTHLISFWGALGTTDPGSSGSPLFDGNRRIVGQLHGGPSFCGATGSALRDYYGRFFTSWTGGGTTSTQLRNWLDPDNSSTLTTDGVKPQITGPATVSGTGAFSLNVLNPSVVSWTVTGVVGVVSPVSGVGNVASLSALSTASSLTITFSINDGQSYPITFSRTFNTEQITTPPPSGSALALLPPAYNCQTGEITFNTSGGDGTPIIYSAVGVQRATATSNTGTVEPGLRADPKPLTITATQSGATVSISFDFAASCSGPGSGTSTPPPSGSALALLPPTYNCQTGEITFNTSGGDGTPIIYSAVGVQRATATSNTGTVEPGLRADPKPLTITATQSGATVSISFDFAASCSGPGSGTSTPPPSGSALALLTPTYNCSTGEITFNTSGGDGSPIVYSAVGVQRPSASSNTGVVEPGLRADPKPLFITATQSGVTVSISFNFGGFCSGSTRLASREPGAGLNVEVLGNPVMSDQVTLRIRGAHGQALCIQTIDASGRFCSEQLVGRASAEETVQVRLGRGTGVYLLRVQSGNQLRTTRVMKVN